MGSSWWGEADNHRTNPKPHSNASRTAAVEGGRDSFGSDEHGSRTGEGRLHTGDDICNCPVGTTLEVLEALHNFPFLHTSDFLKMVLNS